MDIYFILLFLGVANFFLWKWILTKSIKDEKKRKMAVWLATVVMTPLVYVLLVLLLLLYVSYTPSIDFDRFQWQNNKIERYQMANNIIKSKMLIGKDTNQIKQMLGEPTRSAGTTVQWTYDMGMGGGGLGFIFHSLLVKFKNQKVFSVEHGKISD